MSKVSAMPKPETAKATESNPFGNLAERITHKRQAFELAKNAIEAAKAIEIDATAKASALEAATGNVTSILAKAMIAGLFLKDEASAMLGDAYGYKPKSDGTPGKTPEGTGNSIRKRVVLLAEAARIVAGEIKEADYPKWMTGKSAESIAPYVNQWLADEMSASTAYAKLSEREKAVSVDLPFNEKRLLELVEALTNPEKRERIAGNPALVAAYDAIAAAWQGEISF